MRRDEARALLDSIGLDFNRYTYGELEDRNARDIAEIGIHLKGTGLMEWGELLAGSPESVLASSYSKAQIKQNWIMIRQNEIIIRLLTELCKANGAENCDMIAILDQTKKTQQEELEGGFADSSLFEPEVILQIPISINDGITVAIGEEVMFSGLNVIRNNEAIGTFKQRYVPPLKDALSKSGARAFIASDDGEPAKVAILA